ncbi:unnamed protein product [Scytosiphon promiscuus]
MYLHFPDLDANATGKPEKLQIGFCYMPGLAPPMGAKDHRRQRGVVTARGSAAPIDPESEIVRPLRVRNVSDRKLYLTCTPNLRKQCFVYSEILPESHVSAGEDGHEAPAVPNRTQVADMPLLPQSETTLYIGLRPVLPPEAYTSGDCRELIGGVRVMGHSRPLSGATEDSERGSRSGSRSDTNEEQPVAAGSLPPSTSQSSAAGEGSPSAAVADAAESGGGASSAEGTARPLASPTSGLGPEAVATRRLAADRLFELTIKFVGTVGVSILRLRRHDSAFSLLTLADGGTSSSDTGRKWELPRTIAADSEIDEADTASGTSSVVPSAAPLWGRGRKGTPASLPGARILYGSVELENVTKALPLVYRLCHGSGARRCEDIVILHEQEAGYDIDRAMEEDRIAARLARLPVGSAELVMLASDTGTLPPATKKCLRFCVLLNGFQGVFQRDIAMENISARGRDGDASPRKADKLSHPVRLFVDDGAISVSKAPSPEKLSPGLVPPHLNARVPSGSAADLTEIRTMGALLYDSSTRQEAQLVDESGHGLPPLETLSLPFVIAVASPYSTDAVGHVRAESFASSLFSGFSGDEDGRSPGSTRPEMHEIEEQRDDTEPPQGGQHYAEPGELVFQVTNVLNRCVILAPYSDLPFAMKASVVEGGGVTDEDEEDDEEEVMADDATEGIFEFESISAKSDHGEQDTCGGGGSGGPGQNEIVDDGGSAAASGACDNIATVSSFRAEPGEGTGVAEREDLWRGLRLMRCGPPMSLPARATAIVRLRLRTGALTHSLPTAAVESGQAVEFEGMVALARIGVEYASVDGGRFGRETEALVVPEEVLCSGGVAPADGKEGGNPSSATEAPSLVKLLRTVGTFCRPRFEVVGSANVDLGKVGHTISRRGRRRFEVRLRSLCDTAVPVGMVGISPELEVVTEVEGGGDGKRGAAVYKALVPRRSVTLRRSSSAASYGDSLSARGDCSSYPGGGSSSGSGGGGSGGFVPSSLRERSRASNAAAAVDGGCTDVVWVPARGEATLVVQLRLSRRRQSWAGPQAFRISLVNLADPYADEVAVSVTARVVTQLVSIIGLDEAPPSPISQRLYSPGTPTPLQLGSSALRRRARSSSIEAFGSFGTPEGGSLRLSPLAIPPLRGATGRCARTFQVKNVSGETVAVTLGVTPATEVAEVLSLGASLQQQDASTGVYASVGSDGRSSPSVALLPGDVLDVQAECLALPGARLPPDLLPPPDPTLAEAERMAAQAAAAWVSRDPMVDWGQHIRLLGMLRVEIALEERAGDADLMGLVDGTGASASGNGQEEGVLVETVALVGSLVPGPAFGLSRTSVTVTLRPPESGGGGGGGRKDGKHPYDPEGPASFFVESFLQSLGPVRLKFKGGGRLFLGRGVRVPAAEDEGGGRRRPARVVRLVTAAVEPSRVVVSTNRRREVAVKLVAAEDGVEGDDDDGSAGGALEHQAEDESDLFVSITDADYPGYPPQVVSVQVEVPADAMISDGEEGGGILPGTGIGSEGPIHLLPGGEAVPGGNYGLSNGDIVDVPVQMAAEEARVLARSRCAPCATLLSTSTAAASAFSPPTWSSRISPTPLTSRCVEPTPVIGGASVGGGVASGVAVGGTGNGEKAGGVKPLVLDYGDVYEGKLYQRRSFVIVNRSSMPLEFQLSSSLPASELNFSLSAVTLKQFKSVHVEAKTRLQVYAHYRPIAKKPAAAAAAVGRRGSQRILNVLPDDPGKEAEAVAVRERLSITCRLVKDFQQEIQLFARCAVYNRRHPTEQHRISLKLTSGALRMFFLSPGSKNAYPFSALEDKITTFLQAYQWMWKEFLELEPRLNAVLRERESDGAAFKESGLLVFQRALDHLDAAMIAAGEPRSTVSGSRRNSTIAAIAAGPSTGQRLGGGASSVGRGGGGGDRRLLSSPAPPGAAAAPSAGGPLVTVAQQCSRLIFEMFYITDELLYYALKHEGFVGEFAFRLANLVYSVVFRHEVFVSFGELTEREGSGSSSEEAPVFLRRWGAHVNHFLGYFPYPEAKPVILPLVELRRSLAPCFAALPAGDKGRAREGTPSKDDAPSPKNAGSEEVLGGGGRGGSEGNVGQSSLASL